MYSSTSTASESTETLTPSTCSRSRPPSSAPASSSRPLTPLASTGSISRAAGFPAATSTSPRSSC
jgi:hypothetical protein